MRVGLISLMMYGAAVLSSGAEEPIRHSFNNCIDGPIDGQVEWNVYNKVKDSSALSVMDVLGTSEADGDKALVIRRSKTPIRCVTGEYVRWLPGRTLTVEFDFKIAGEPVTLSHNKPIMTVMVGNSLLSTKARWSIGLEATPNGDWQLVGALPDSSSRKIYGENFLIRSADSVSISDWYHFVLVIEKGSEPDTFNSSVEIRHAVSQKILTAIAFKDTTKDRVTGAMWNTIRAHVGFSASKDQYGLACIDNLEFSSSE